MLGFRLPSTHVDEWSVYTYLPTWLLQKEVEYSNDGKNKQRAFCEPRQTTAIDSKLRTDGLAPTMSDSALPIAIACDGRRSIYSCRRIRRKTVAEPR